MKLWTELENYKGRKAALRKIQQVTPEFEEEGKNLEIRKNLYFLVLKNLRIIYQ